MPVATIAGQDVHVDAEGFMTEFEEWSEEIAGQLAANIGIEMTDDHWKVVRFVRDDFMAEGETPTLRRVTAESGVPTKELFLLFPKKPGKKMAYVSGLPKPKGCI